MAKLLSPTKYGARRLRRNMTGAERRLWARLRDHQLGGWAFRRQHPIPPYVADFACIDVRVVVEVDGGQHAESKSDQKRDDFLASQGWRVIRFWNNDVLANTEGVLMQLLAALGPHPNPPPR
jgi:very-short-patch-repair endonuclease